ncbi:hypothetical protein ABIB40_004201, partial [Pedobacter sp. UYP30]
VQIGKSLFQSNVLLNWCRSFGGVGRFKMPCNGLKICAEMALLAEPLSHSTKLSK